MSADDGPQCHPILTAQRVVRDECIELTIVLVGQILLALDVQGHIEIPHTLLQPLGSLLVSALPEEAVYIVFVHDSLEPRHQKTGNILGLWPHLPCQNLVDIDCFLKSFHTSFYAITAMQK